MQWSEPERRVEWVPVCPSGGSCRRGSVTSALRAYQHLPNTSPANNRLQFMLLSCPPAALLYLDTASELRI